MMREPYDLTPVYLKMVYLESALDIPVRQKSFVSFQIYVWLDSLLVGIQLPDTEASN